MNVLSPCECRRILEGHRMGAIGVIATSRNPILSQRATPLQQAADVRMRRGDCAVLRNSRGKLETLSVSTSRGSLRRTMTPLSLSAPQFFCIPEQLAHFF